MVITQGGGSVSWTSCLGFTLTWMGSPGDTLGCWGQGLCTDATKSAASRRNPQPASFPHFMCCSDLAATGPASTTACGFVPHLLQGRARAVRELGCDPASPGVTPSPALWHGAVLVPAPPPCAAPLPARAWSWRALHGQAHLHWGCRATGLGPLPQITLPWQARPEDTRLDKARAGTATAAPASAPHSKPAPGKVPTASDLHEQERRRLA